MEAPTTRRAAARAGFPSARMLEAQRAFQGVVKQELQLLLEGGTRREEAVKLLLRRIVASTEPPEAVAVRGVMRQFQMNHDDAVRALIVKQELGRLKRQGLDSFAAIEELTRKMRSREDEEVEGEVEVEREEGEVEHKDILGNEEKEEEQQVSTQEQEAQEEREKADQRTPMPAAEMASPSSDKDGNETSLSLCQRIGQVSISSGNTPEREAERDDEQEASEDTDGEENESVGEKNKTVFKSPLRVRSPSSTNLADLTPQSRKRRAAFGVQFDTASNSRSSNGGLSVKPLFPSLKKQKLCAEVGDGFLQVVTRKSKPTSQALSKSTSAAATSGSSHNGNAGGGPTTLSDLVTKTLNTKTLHKRQRDSTTGMQDDDESPITEELRVSRVHHRHHAHHHHSKRHKTGSNH